MMRFVLAVAVAASAMPAFAQTEKEVNCGHQADVAAAIVQARLDGVKERDLSDALAKNATWPAKYSEAMIPVIGAYIYQQDRKQLRQTDVTELRASTFSQCMSLE